MTASTLKRTLLHERETRSSQDNKRLLSDLPNHSQKPFLKAFTLLITSECKMEVRIRLAKTGAFALGFSVGNMVNK